MRNFTKTKDHTLIKKWAEDRHGKPAISIQGNDQEEGSLLRIKFDDDEKNLVTISWTEFFSIFDEHNLTFAYEQNNIPALPTYFKNWLKHNTGIQWSSTTQLWKQLYDR